jgi:hypothetical protein
VAGEIAADLSSRRVGQALLLLGLLTSGLFLWSLHGTAMQGLASLARSFGGATGGPLDAAAVAGVVGSWSARTFYWIALYGGALGAALFAPPLLDPRRTVLMLAQPISRSDHALGIYLAVCTLAGLAACFFCGLLFGGFRVLGIAVPTPFLLLPLPLLCGFAAVYAAVLLATYAVRSAPFAAIAGLALLIACTVLGSSQSVRPGAQASAAWLVYGLCPKLVELSGLAARVGEGGALSPAPFVSTLVPTVALLLFLSVAARRSER